MLIQLRVEERENYLEKITFLDISSVFYQTRCMLIQLLVEERENHLEKITFSDIYRDFI